MSYNWKSLKPVRFKTPRMLSIIGLLCIITLLSFMSSCGGGGEPANIPPVTSTAALTGSVIFMETVSLAAPPADMFDGPAPADLHYAARIIDPGDDIGGAPLPKPGNLSSNGHYHFENNDANPLAYFNLRFIVNADLTGDNLPQTPVSLNIPVALANAFGTYISIIVSRPADNILELTYTYNGPDGSRKILLQLNFLTDLIYFDLDSDGLFDDLIAIDYNNDAIPDSHASYMEILDYTTTVESFGSVSGVGSNTLFVEGIPYEIWGNTNIVSKVDGATLAMSDISTGRNATVKYSIFNGANIAENIVVEPGPTNPFIDFKVVRSGDIEEIDANSLVAGGVRFQDYASATIKNSLGSTVAPSELETGMYVSVTGTRDGNIITAEEITVTEVSPPPSYIERQGTIQALDTPGNPSLITVSEITFQITPQTAIMDNTGLAVDSSYLLTGSPVHIIGREDQGVFIADLIELLYAIDTDGREPEVVILLNNADVLADVQNVIDQVSTQIAVVPVLVSSYPPPLSAPPCTYGTFNSVFLAKPILLGIPGFIEAFPRFENDQCEVLVLLDDGYPTAKAWVDYFYPNGIGAYGTDDGYPIVYDNIVTPPFYGAGPEMVEAIQLSDNLRTLLSDNDFVIDVYISPEISFYN
ncbi:MAG: DUF5666 domain-containing protein [bacterium]|nr:DUF5666 domain-containing protein [bacterium]